MNKIQITENLNEEIMGIPYSLFMELDKIQDLARK